MPGGLFLLVGSVLLSENLSVVVKRVYNPLPTPEVVFLVLNKFSLVNQPLNYQGREVETGTFQLEYNPWRICLQVNCS